MSRETGLVKWFSSEKGYGFIERDGHDDVFVHHSEITMEGFRTLDAGERVEFETVADDRGPRAHRVAREDGADPVNGRSNGRSSHNGNGYANGNGATTVSLVSQIRNKLFGRLTNRA